MEEKEVDQQRELQEEDQDPNQDTIDTTTDTTAATTIPNQDDFVQEHNTYYYNDDEQQLQYQRVDRNSIDDDDIAHPYSYNDDYYPIPVGMFHDDDHMVSIPPHVLSTPTHLELPRHLGKSGDGSSGTSSTTDVNPCLMDEYVLIPV